MVIKSLSRKGNIKGLFTYLFNPAKQLPGEKPFIIRHNLRARTNIEKLAAEFKINESYRLHPRKNAAVIHHTVLSFSPLDKEHLTGAVLKRISKQFMKEYGRDNLFVGILHKDKSHPHLHVISSGVRYLSGESNRLSKAQFHAVKLSMTEYQKSHFPQLCHSLPEHNKSKNGEPDKVRAEILQGRSEKKKMLLIALENCYQSVHSREEFFAQLESIGTPYYRAGMLTGIKLDGIKFRFARLGFTEERLHELDAKEFNETSELQTLQEIREPQSEPVKEPLEDKRCVEKSEEETALSNLRIIRKRGMPVRTLFERE